VRTKFCLGNLLRRDKMVECGLIHVGPVADSCTHSELPRESSGARGKAVYADCSLLLNPICIFINKCLLISVLGLQWNSYTLMCFMSHLCPLVAHWVAMHETFHTLSCWCAEHPEGRGPDKSPRLPRPKGGPVYTVIKFRVSNRERISWTPERLSSSQEGFLLCVVSHST
jgi:hypothetical protein